MANEFFTLASLGTLAGATGATVAITNGLKTALNLNPRWLGLIVAEVVCFSVLVAGGPTHPSDWFIGFLNGFLVFATSAGATSVGAAATGNAAADQGAASRSGNVHREGEATKRAVPTRPPFWFPWF